MNQLIERANQYGYPTIHLFGDWYLGRVYSKSYKKFSPWWVYHVAPPSVIFDDVPSAPPTHIHPSHETE